MAQPARSAQDWHRRFQQQAGWTRSARRYLLRRAGLGRFFSFHREMILETGCGTGAITRLLHSEARCRVFGIDLNLDYLKLASQNDPLTDFSAANGLSLPFADDTFSAVVCHFFLLWVPEPELVLAEMARVTRQGGAVIAFAEPDYGGRVDAPPTLAELGRQQANALARQGAAPNRGRELTGLFRAAGLKRVECGVLGSLWTGRPADAEIAEEWAVLRADLAGVISKVELEALEQVNQKAWEDGVRVLYVPTFYALGWK